ncbi:MAG: serine--tRNA ligase [Candidatus Paceibacterota bacterium]|nr:serine--tRNA ligase [Candidatus Nomurabacteria bacterium]
MLDIKFIRENLDIVKEGAKKKNVDIDLDALIALDDKRLALTKEVDEFRAKKNSVSDMVAKESDPSKREQMISEMKALKDDFENKEKELKEVIEKWQEAMLYVPNIPDMAVPFGKDDADNQEIKAWGDKTSFSFEAKDHMEILEALDMIDVERGTKVHGFRGYYLKGDVVNLCFAIWQYALEFFANGKGFVPVLPPTVVKKKFLYGTAHLPGDVEDFYETQDGDVLAGTAEVPLMAMYSDEVLDKSMFPVKYLGFSPCYRREAGSHGKDTKGLIRVNEFYKFEQLILCEADHELSVKYHEEINRNTEEFIESMEIPYHTVLNCGGDLGLGQVKKYDIELWVPKEEKYREISSASYFHDFQTRRFGTRYKDDDGKMKFAHSLNCTAIPTPRILVSLIENFQTQDGNVKIPKALVKYFGKEYLK